MTGVQTCALPILFHHKGIDAGLAAGIFHQKLLTIRDLKEYLNANGVEMRL